VLGLGYIGLPTASTFATHGIEVVGVDTNPHVIETLRNGGLHIHEPGLRTLVGAALGSGNLRINKQPESANAYIIAVPTPFLEDKRADLSYVAEATQAITPYLSKQNLVVLESTSPPRTTIDIVAPILENPGLKAGEDFYLAYSPERVLPGHILRELIENARVIGGVNQRSSEAGRDLYKIFARGEIILTDSTTAEIVKLMENTYRDVNIAVANEFSRLADRFGIDIWNAINIANRHPRVNILNPGPGVGGHCIGVDPWFLVEAAPDITPLIKTARRVNDSQPEYVVDLIGNTLKIHRENQGLKGSHIAILGLAYKADVDDIRESPAIAVSRLLIQAGAHIKIHDPIIVNPDISEFNFSNSLEDVLSGADLIALLVPHTQLKTINPEIVSSLTDARLVVDTVNAWDVALWQSHGFHIKQLGDGQI